MGLLVPLVRKLDVTGEGAGLAALGFFFSLLLRCSPLAMAISLAPKGLPRPDIRAEVRKGIRLFRGFA